MGRAEGISLGQARAHRGLGESLPWGGWGGAQLGVASFAAERVRPGRRAGSGAVGWTRVVPVLAGGGQLPREPRRLCPGRGCGTGGIPAGMGGVPGR